MSWPCDALALMLAIAVPGPVYSFAPSLSHPSSFHIHGPTRSPAQGLRPWQHQGTARGSSSTMLAKKFDKKYDDAFDDFRTSGRSASFQAPRGQCMGHFRPFSDCRHVRVSVQYA
jgi:hypothetical protein